MTALGRVKLACEGLVAFFSCLKTYTHVTVSAYTAVEFLGWSVEWLLIDCLDVPISTGNVSMYYKRSLVLFFFLHCFQNKDYIDIVKEVYPSVSQSKSSLSRPLMTADIKHLLSLSLSLQLLIPLLVHSTCISMVGMVDPLSTYSACKVRTGQNTWVFPM